MASKTTRCPSCGTEGDGNFCKQCGAPLAPRSCPSCQAAIPPGARFCTKCGTPTSGGAAAPAGGDRKAWAIAAVATSVLLVAVLALVIRGNKPAQEGAGPVDGAGAAAPFADASGGGGAPPDLSTMTPRERFDRLYNRIMRAAESGDQQTVTTFTPMAMMAYQQLDTVDADARFHLATLKLHAGDVAGATAIADTILQQNPGHLFGYILQGTAARWSKDDKALRKAYAAFLAHYDAEIKKARPEYADHQRMMDDFHQAAISGP